VIVRNLLYVRCSLFGEDGESSRLAMRLVRRFQAIHPDAALTVRDVQRPPLPHLDAATFRAFALQGDALTPEDRDRLRLSDRLIAELAAASDLLIALPLYNFSIPSAFKAWIDHVTRARATFRYTAHGAEGLLGNIERCWVIAARGGVYQGTPTDTQSPYLRLMLGFLGIAPPTFVYAEGLARPNLRDAALEAAGRAVDELPL
jgi:FMN-dependent NADH-azoreductase